MLEECSDKVHDSVEVVVFALLPDVHQFPQGQAVPLCGRRRLWVFPITAGMEPWFRGGLFGSWRRLVEVLTPGLGVQAPLVPFPPPCGHLLSALVAALVAVFLPLGYHKFVPEVACENRHPPLL